MSLAESAMAHNDAASSAKQLSGARQKWAAARAVLTAVEVSAGFSTLRDLVGDACIDSARLKLIRPLGEGAFAKVQLAELAPAAAAAAAAQPGVGPAATATARATAKDTGQGRQVAVKTLRQDLVADPEQVKLFMKEVALCRRLRYKHIVEFVGCSWSRNWLMDDSAKGEQAQALMHRPTELFFVQEYCAGGSVSDLLRLQMANPFHRLYSDADALRWCTEIAEALQYLHEARPVVIHRDLKLENIMLTGADLTVAHAKLADFGLARLLAPARKEKMVQLSRILSQPAETWDRDAQMRSQQLEVFLETVLTKTVQEGPAAHPSPPASDEENASSGTPTLQPCISLNVATSAAEMTGRTGSFGYMAPEVTRGLSYNWAADIFSLGMCMYNLFARTVPSVQILMHGGDMTQLAVYAAKVSDGYRPPMPPNIPVSVAKAIEACWKGDPFLRPRARAVVEMLQTIRDSGDVGVSGHDGHIAVQGCECSIM